MKALFDSNILIDHLNGRPEAKRELELYSDKLISIITWMEVMVGTWQEHEGTAGRFLNNFRTVELERHVATLAVSLRRQYRLKLPDAIIYATARSEGCLLVTRNSRDFDAELPDVRVPYSL